MISTATPLIGTHALAVREYHVGAEQPVVAAQRSGTAHHVLSGDFEPAVAHPVCW